MTVFRLKRIVMATAIGWSGLAASAPWAQAAGTFDLPRGASLALTSVFIRGCNNNAYGYERVGVTEPPRILGEKPYACEEVPQQPDVTVGPFESDRTIRFFLIDATCGETFPADGSHATVTGSNPFTVDIVDAGGFCESPPSVENHPDPGGGHFSAVVTFVPAPVVDPEGTPTPTPDPDPTPSPTPTPGEEPHQPTLVPGPPATTQKPAVSSGDGRVSIRFKQSFDPPPGMRRAAVCHGRVDVRLRVRGRLIARDRVRLDRRCHYRVTFRVRRQRLGAARTVTIVASFRGNERLGPVTQAYRVRLPGDR